MSDRPSAKFAEIYDALPPEVRQAVVEKHLALLLDVVPHDLANSVISSTSQLQRDLYSMPSLDVKGKRKEVNTLLDALNRDAKISIIKERSRNTELLAELADSLTSWVVDIWSVVYEYNVNYIQAHACLLFIAEVVSQLTKETSGGCTLMSMPLNVTIKNRNAEIVQSFSLKGFHKIERVILWVWRDLFVSLLVNGSHLVKKSVPELLEEIENVMGWSALELLLCGGKKEEDFDDEDDISDDLDEVECSPRVINHSIRSLQSFVQKHLQKTFEIIPSLGLFRALRYITADDECNIDDWLFSVLSENATNTSDTLVAALDIYSEEEMANEIAPLLNSYAYLLRPQDAQSLQAAVTVLSDSDSVLWQHRGLQILEKELNDCISSIIAAIKSAFSRINDQKQDLNEILKLRVGTQTREDRVQQWLDAITTSSFSVHPIAFAAMMMGFPVGPGVEDGEDPDLNTYLDMGPSDRDLDDLREEFKPNIAGRFSGWCNLASSTKGGSTVSAKVYLDAVEKMPFLRAPDIVSEMLSRLNDRPSKTHVTMALETLSDFCKSQRKKISVRRANEQSSTFSNTHPPMFGNNGPSGFPFSFNGSGSSNAYTGPPAPRWGGMEDVD